MAASDNTYKILIADDSTILNNMLRDVFEERGYEVFQAFGGGECKTLFLKEKPDVVLVDGRMPTSDCIEVLKYIKQRNPRTVTVIMTAPGNEHLALRALKLGADDYLQKPFSTDEVLALVAKLLDKRKAAEEAAKLNSQIVRQDRYLAELTTVINEALITTDPKGRVQFINRAG
ncbi:MAG: response regulator, partial [Desulfomonilaceae bacterium]